MSRPRVIAGRVLFSAAVVILLAAIAIPIGGGIISAVTRRHSGQLIAPAPRVAAGLPRFTGVATRPANKQVIDTYQRRFQRLIGGPGTGYMHAMYGMPGLADPATNGAAWVMYLGYNPPAPYRDSQRQAERLMSVLAGQTRSWPVSPGVLGGSARCGQARLGAVDVAICGWVTGANIGVVMSPLRTTSTAVLAALMRQMRPDLAGLPRTPTL